MDPNQAWREIAEAVEQHDWELAAERAESLAEWLGIRRNSRDERLQSDTLDEIVTLVDERLRR